jgi:hypothetical protein
MDLSDPISSLEQLVMEHCYQNKLEGEHQVLGQR